MVGNKYAVALVGYGGMGHWHAKLLKDFEEICLYGIYDINPEKLEAAKADGYVAYNSFAELCADEKVDVVLVATPNDFHKPIALQAFAAGKKGRVTEYLAGLENRKIKREALQQLLQTAWRAAAEALLLQSGKREAEPALADGAALLAQNLGRRRLAALTDILHRYALECQYNVGSGHVLGALAAEWENTL